jgi:hypothetical protein
MMKFGQGTWHEDVHDNDEWAVYANDQPDDIFLRGRARGDCRRDITQKLELLGVIQPLQLWPIVELLKTFSEEKLICERKL